MVAATHSVAALKKVPLLRGLGLPSLTRVSKDVCFKTYEPENWIIAYGEETCNVYFIIEGKATVSVESKDGVRVSFRELSPGDIFGEYAAIDHQPRSATVRARTECCVASLSDKKFRKLLYDEPDLAWALLAHFVEETRELTRRVYEFSTLCVNYRVQAELLRLARQANVLESDNQSTIDPAPSDAEIAGRISTHREAVNREIGRLSKRGVLERHGRLMLVKDMAALEEMVHEALGE